LELPPFLASLLPNLQAMLDDPAQWVAIASAALAAVLVMVSAFVKTIIPLRWLALGSNVGFMVYGLVHPQWLMFLLHAALLPVNLWRVLEMRRLTRRVRQTGDNSARSDLWLQPHMRRRRLARGRVLFKKGDLADRLYVLVEGHLELVESGLRIPEGRMFGEIAFFAPDRRRSATARCVTRCTVLSIDETTFQQLYFQNPAFGFEVVRLIAGRLSADVQRLQQQIGPVPAAPPDVPRAVPPAAPEPLATATPADPPPRPGSGAP